MKKGNAIARRDHRYHEINQPPWLLRDYANTQRLRDYRHRQRVRESRPRRRGSDQPITEDFIPGAEAAFTRRAYVTVITVAVIILFMVWLAAYFIRQ